ncbi:MAG: tetratricopeptide repeat protein [Hyphomicrobiales bacterium]|nr:tetratricopeptide repeat protein [Hyphomicrobiales bacterium]
MRVGSPLVARVALALGAAWLVAGPASRSMAAAPVAAPLAKQPQPVPSLSESRRQMLAKLYARLAATTNAQEGVMIAARIQTLQMRSGSATSDLLLSRAMDVAAKHNTTLALKLLDQVVVLDPSWPEGWNQRATLRFQANDDAGSMRDIARVLKLEPRHFGALSGMAEILLRHGLDKDALVIDRRLLQIYPTMSGLKKTVDDLTLKVEGRPI